MTFRIPVSTQEPIEVKPARPPNVDQIFVTGIGTAVLADYSVRLDVPPGCRRRVLGIVYRSVQNADTDQYFEFSINKTFGTAPNQSIFIVRFAPHTTNAIYVGSGCIGNSGLITSYSVGAQAYIDQQIAIPDIIMEDGWSASFNIRNVDNNSTYNLYIIYEETYP